MNVFLNIIFDYKGTVPESFIRVLGAAFLVASFCNFFSALSRDFASAFCSFCLLTTVVMSPLLAFQILELSTEIIRAQVGL